MSASPIATSYKASTARSRNIPGALMSRLFQFRGLRVEGPVAEEGPQRGATLADPYGLMGSVAGCLSVDCDLFRVKLSYFPSLTSAFT